MLTAGLIIFTVSGAADAIRGFVTAMANGIAAAIIDTVLLNSEFSGVGFMDVDGGDADMDNLTDNKPVTEDFMLLSNNKVINFIEVLIAGFGEPTLSISNLVDDNRCCAKQFAS